MGYIPRQFSKAYILQGKRPEIDRHDNDGIIDLNDYCYHVNNQLVIDGWNPIQPIPIDKNFFSRRKRTLLEIGFPNIIEERSTYVDDGKPCMVIYGRY